jgi:predicted DNA-binding transcriptional regulator YafY
MDRFDRIFELNRILQTSRYPVSRQRLEEALACSRATVKRLIEEMRLYLNAPIVYDRKLNGYRYDPAEGEMYQLPGLWFNASELQALLAAQQLLEGVQPGLLDSHLQPLRRKIDTLLSRQAGSAEPVTRRIRLLQAAARPAGPYFTLIAGALAARKRLQITYYNRSLDSLSQRELSPQRLTHYRDNWYLDAWCHLRGGLRTFALDAIREASALDSQAKEVEASLIESHYTGTYGIFSGQARYRAVLRFKPERARWISMECWHPQQQCRWLPDGSYELTIPYSQPDELVKDLLGYGPDVEVIEPASLRDLMARKLRATLDIYT